MLGFLRIDPSLEICHQTSAILYQPWATRGAAVVAHRVVRMSDAREMLLRPVSENGTMRFPVENCLRNNSVRFRPVDLRYISIYGNLLNLTYVTDIWSVGKKFGRGRPRVGFLWGIAW